MTRATATKKRPRTAAQRRASRGVSWRAAVLDLAEWLHQWGAEPVSFTRWQDRTCPESSHSTAARLWQRKRVRFKSLGVDMTMSVVGSGADASYEVSLTQAGLRRAQELVDKLDSELAHAEEIRPTRGASCPADMFLNLEDEVGEITLEEERTMGKTAIEAKRIGGVFLVHTHQVRFATNDDGELSILHDPDREKKEDVSDLVALIRAGGWDDNSFVEIAKRGQKEDGDDDLIMVDGRRRLRATEIVNEEKIAAGEEPIRMRAVLVRGDADHLFALMLRSNQGRKDYKAETEARLIHKYMTKLGRTVDEVAEKLGMSVSWVQKRLDVLEAPKPVREALREGRITFSDFSRDMAGKAEAEQLKVLAVVPQTRPEEQAKVQANGNGKSGNDAPKRRKKLRPGTAVKAEIVDYLGADHALAVAIRWHAGTATDKELVEAFPKVRPVFEDKKKPKNKAGF